MLEFDTYRLRGRWCKIKSTTHEYAKREKFCRSQHCFVLAFLASRPQHTCAHTNPIESLNSEFLSFTCTISSQDSPFVILIFYLITSYRCDGIFCLSGKDFLPPLAFLSFFPEIREVNFFSAQTEKLCEDKAKSEISRDAKNKKYRC